MVEPNCSAAAGRGVDFLGGRRAPPGERTADPEWYHGGGPGSANARDSATRHYTSTLIPEFRRRTNPDRGPARQIVLGPRRRRPRPTLVRPRSPGRRLSGPGARATGAHSDLVLCSTAARTRETWERAQAVGARPPAKSGWSAASTTPGCPSWSDWCARLRTRCRRCCCWALPRDPGPGRARLRTHRLRRLGQLDRVPDQRPRRDHPHRPLARAGQLLGRADQLHHPPRLALPSPLPPPPPLPPLDSLRAFHPSAACRGLRWSLA